MNIHKSARSCPKSRALMVFRVLEERRSVAAVAEGGYSNYILPSFGIGTDRPYDFSLEAGYKVIW